MPVCNEQDRETNIAPDRKEQQTYSGYYEKETTQRNLIRGQVRWCTTVQQTD